MIGEKDFKRFWNNIVTTNPEECWLWQGAIFTQTGYGSCRLDGYHTTAHRVSYRLLVGEIPEGLVIDHLCRVRACVNPGHLEPVTQQINTLRGEGPTARKAKQLLCQRGHEFTFKAGWKRPARRCDTCKYEANKRRRLRISLMSSRF